MAGKIRYHQSEKEPPQSEITDLQDTADAAEAADEAKGAARGGVAVRANAAETADEAKGAASGGAAARANAAETADEVKEGARGGAAVRADAIEAVDEVKGAVSEGWVLAENEGACTCCKMKHRSDREYRDLINRLRRIEGQIRGIRGMVERDCYCPDILVQVAAANAALNSFNKVLLANHIRTCVADGIREGSDEKVDELVEVLQKLMK